MRTVKVLHNFFSKAVPNIHATRLTALMIAVESALSGAQVSITELGRRVNARTFVKHNIKRIDRLVGNPHLLRERKQLYAAITRQLVGSLSEPIILIDWSPLCDDQKQHVLRAAIPVKGRSLTLYEEIYPREQLGNRYVQHRFLDTLKQHLPTSCQPIIVGDSGFRVPFYRYVESLGWHWVGRIRGRDFIANSTAPAVWYSIRMLCQKAAAKPVCLGVFHWVRSHPLTVCLTLVRRERKHRHRFRLDQKSRQSKDSRGHAKREREPWLLVYGVSLRERTAKQIVKIYQTRMQIEEGFRDTKSHRFGLGISSLSRIGIHRRAILLLIATLAIFILWVVGLTAQGGLQEKRMRVNSSSKRATYSVVFMARLLLQHQHFKVPATAYDRSMNYIARYLQELLWE